MILYYVVNQRAFVCGPFRDLKYAQRVAEDYSKTLWGKCYVEAECRRVEGE